MASWTGRDVLVFDRTLASVLCLAAMCASPCVAQVADKKVTFDDDVVSIFRARCGTCHNGSDQRGGLTLDTYAGLMAGGSSGDVVFGGDVESSYLWMLITHESDPVMPPNSPKMPEGELAVIKAWIEQGLLENAGSKAKKSAPNPALAKVAVSAERPEGPPPMPAKYLGDPAFVPKRGNSVTALAVNPWSSVAAVAGHEQITLHDLNRMAPLGSLPFPEGQPHRIGFSQNGQIVWVAGGRAGQSGVMALYQLSTGERLATLGQEYDAAIAADLSPDLSLAVLGTPKKLVRVYDVATGDVAYQSDKHTDWVTATTFSPDGVLLATGDRSGGLVVWEAETGREFHVLGGHKGAVNAIAWRGDSNVLATVGSDNRVRLWEMNDGKQVKEFEAGVKDVTDVEFTRDGQLLFTGRTKVARLFDPSGKHVRDFGGLPDDALRVAYDHEGGRVLAGDWSGRVFVWNAPDAKKQGELRTNTYGANAQVAWLSKVLAKQTSELTKVTADVTALETDLNTRAAALVNAKQALEQATKQHAVAQNALVQQNIAVAEAKSTLDAHAKALTDAESAQQAATDALTTAQTAVQVTVGVRDTAQKAVDAVQEETVKTALQKSLAEAETAVQTAEQTLANANAAVTTATTALDEARVAKESSEAAWKKRVAERQQSSAAMKASASTLAACQKTHQQADAVARPSDDEAKQLATWRARRDELSKKIGPMETRRSVLQEVLALGK